MLWWQELPLMLHASSPEAGGPGAGAVALNTVGALDLGGGSLEVTFVPPPGAAIADPADAGAPPIPHRPPLPRLPTVRG